MCGICAYIGNGSAYPCIYNGLVVLQNRGYDSAGITVIDENKTFITRKYASTVERSAIARLANLEDVFKNSSVGVGHVRWRTSSPATDENSHPHLDYLNRFALVHNGIIENHLELKEELLAKGVTFRSQTDTEVIVNLLSVNYNETKNVKKALTRTLRRLEGTWGLVIICLDKPNRLYCVRHGSPLLIGFGYNDEFMMVASEQSAFYRYVNNYICLDESDIVVLKKVSGKVIFKPKNSYAVRRVSTELSISLSPDPYPHWMLKEIYEQSESSIRAMGMGSRLLEDKAVRLGGLSQKESELRDVNHLLLLGCGTSYHAGLYTLPLFRSLSGFDTVSVFDGGEFTKYDLPQSGKTALVLISQSGETKDLHRSLELAKEYNLPTIGVVNVVDSLIAREVSCGVYLNAGKEMAVASTKAFTSQVIVLTLMAVWFAQIRGRHDIRRYDIIRDLRKLPLDIARTLEMTSHPTKELAKELTSARSLFVLGRGPCEAIAKEGALKIKEVTYIHAEGYSSSSLKHGPYGVLDETVPVIIINPHDEYFSRNCSTTEEIISRHAKVIGISDQRLPRCHFEILLPRNPTFQGLLAVIPLQLLAYYVSILKGYNPDYPRGLAKTVTVD